MAKFHGLVGFATSELLSPGVYADDITEREYYGDVIREVKTFNQAQNQVNDNLTLGNRISVVGDDFANLNVARLRYVIWGGEYWKIISVEIQRPRLILSLGGLYKGPKAPKPPPVAPS